MGDQDNTLTQPTGDAQNGSVTVQTPPAPQNGQGQQVDWQAEAQRLREENALKDRQLASVRGNHATEKERADKLAAELSRTTSTYEQERTTLTQAQQEANRKAEQAQAEAERERQRAAQLERRVTVSTTVFDPTTYPALASLTPTFKNAVLNEAMGLEGEALTAYLTKANEEAAQVAQTNRRDFRAGTTPAAPAANGGGTNTMSFKEVSAEMNKVLRTKGPNSEEYRSLRALQTDMIKQGLHK